MRRQIAAAALLLTLILPATTLAADPTTVAPAPPPMGGAWEIVAVQADGGSLKVGGKLEISRELMASVGCNTMSATVTSFDGKIVVIGPLTTTEMGCPADLATAESYLASVLGAGSLTLDATSLVSSGGRIDFAPNQPSEPITMPPPDPSGVDPETCAALLGPDWNLGSGSVDPGTSGGSGSGSSSPGSAGSGDGSTGTGEVTPGSGGVDGNTGQVAEPPIAIASAVPAEPPPAPIETPIPVGTPDIGPIPPVASTDAPPIDGGPVPAPTDLPTQPGEPVPSAVAIDPMPPAPADPSMSVEEACWGLLAALQGGKGLAIPPSIASEGGAPLVGADASSAATRFSANAAATAVGLGLAGVILIVMVALLVRRARRQPDVEPPAGQA